MQSERYVSFNVEHVWKSYAVKGQSFGCKKNDWKEGVQECYTGCRRALGKYVGPAKELADHVMEAFEDFVIKLIYFSNSNSTVLAPLSVNILESITKCRKLKDSSREIIREFNKVVISVSEDLKIVVVKLLNILGDLAYSFNDAVDELLCPFTNCMTKLLRCLTADCRKRLDYTPVFQKLQKLINTVGLIADTVLKNCKNAATSELNEAVAMLAVILHWYVIVVQGVNSGIQDILYRDQCLIPQSVTTCSLSLDYVVVTLAETINSIVFPLNEAIQVVLSSLVKITEVFNAAVKFVLGIFEGVTVTVGEITKNLLTGISGGNLLNLGNTNDRTNILKGRDFF